MIDAMQGCEVAGLAARVAEVRDGAAAMTDPASRTARMYSGGGIGTSSERSDDAGRVGRMPARNSAFIRVDVPDAGNPSLIQEERLDPHATAPADAREERCRKGRAQRLHSDASVESTARVGKTKISAKLPDVPIREDSATGKT